MELTARLKRINELAQKAKTEGLTDEEQNERDILRKEYLEDFRKKVRSQIEQIEIVEKDGSVTSLKRKQ